MYCSMEHILSRYSKGIDLECQTNRNEEHGVPEVSITAHSYVFIQKLKCGVRTHISYLHSIKNSKNVKRNNIRLIETQAKRRCFISLKTERWEENEVIFCLCCISISTLFVYDLPVVLKFTILISFFNE